MSSRKLATSTFLAALLTAGMAQAADGDDAKGKKAFKKCSACHKIGDKAKNAVGPVLNGIVGRQAASFPDYKYGKSLKAAGEKGLVWDKEQLMAYLKNPKKYLRAYLEDDKAKSKMSFKLKKDKDRANVVAYLESLGE